MLRFRSTSTDYREGVFDRKKIGGYVVFLYKLYFTPRGRQFSAYALSLLAKGKITSQLVTKSLIDSSTDNGKGCESAIILKPPVLSC